MRVVVSSLSWPRLSARPNVPFALGFAVGIVLGAMTLMRAAPAAQAPEAEPALLSEPVTRGPATRLGWWT